MSKYTDEQLTIALDVLEATSPEAVNTTDYDARKAALAVVEDFLQPQQPERKAGDVPWTEEYEQFALAGLCEVVALKYLLASNRGERDNLGRGGAAVLRFGLGHPLMPGETANADDLRYMIDLCADAVNRISTESPVPQFQLPIWQDRKAALERLLSRCAGQTYTNKGDGEQAA